MSRIAKKENFSIATAAPIVITSITKQEVISAGRISCFLVIGSQVFSSNEESNYTGRKQSDTF